MSQAPVFPDNPRFPYTSQRRIAAMRLVDSTWDLTPQVGDWEKFEHKEWEARCMEVYAAMIDNMDQGIGRIVDALSQQGRLDNTLIMFLQDNGGCQEGVGRGGDWKRPVEPSLPKIADDAIRLDVIPAQNRAGVPTLKGPHVMPGPEDTYIAYGINWANVSNTPFREYKHFVHEGGIATPLIAHWPAVIKRHGELDHQPGHLIDLMATCVDVSGAKYPKEVFTERPGIEPDKPFVRLHRITPMEGVSLVPAFTGKSLGRNPPIFWEHEGNRAVRDGKWKLVAKENKPWELYDMEADRTEMHDLAAEQPGLAKELAAKWDAWAERAYVLPLGAWRGKEKAVKYNKKQKRFELKPGDDLPREKAPFVDGKEFTVTADIAKPATDGVIVAQGGSADGFSLYVKDGELTFATRHSGTLGKVVATDSLPATAAQIEVSLAADGAVTINVEGQALARGKVSGPLSRMPIDGLQVGSDLKGAVGEYEAPFAYKGKIRSVTLDIHK